MRADSSGQNRALTFDSSCSETDPAFMLSLAQAQSPDADTDALAASTDTDAASGADADTDADFAQCTSPLAFTVFRRLS